MISPYNDEYFMRQAILEAEKAYENGEIPIGAVITSNNKIIARAHNQVEKLSDSTAHAEMLAITSAQNNLGSKYLNNCTLYVTLEPCTMCGGALFWSQLGKIVFGASDPDRGYSRLTPIILHPKTTVISGVKEIETKEILQKFFRKLRNKS